MAIFGLLISLLGLLWNFILPINKALWTSSYVLFTGGIASIILAGLTYAMISKSGKASFGFLRSLELILFFFSYYRVFGQKQF